MMQYIKYKLVQSNAPSLNRYTLFSRDDSRESFRTAHARMADRSDGSDVAAAVVVTVLHRDMTALRPST